MRRETSVEGALRRVAIVVVILGALAGRAHAGGSHYGVAPGALCEPPPGGRGEQRRRGRREPAARRGPS